MTAKAKYTLGEWLGISILAPVLVGVTTIVVVIPLMLLTAWVRMLIWNWFAVPDLHAPKLGVWLMAAAGLFSNTFSRSRKSLKPENYVESDANVFVTSFAGQAMTLLLAYLIHAYVLKG